MGCRKLAYYENPTSQLKVVPEETRSVVIIAYRIELENGKVVQGWLLPDPAEQFSNPYLAMGNNPANGYDPNGEFFIIDDLIVGGIAAVGGYVYSGLTTKDWGWQSAKTGLIWGGTALLALNTGGLSLSPSAAAAFGGQFVASQVVGSMMPGMTVPVSDNVSISVSPSLLFGSGPNGFGMGINASAQYTNGDFTFGVGGSTAGFANGNIENRVFGGMTYTSSNSSDTHQNSATIGYTKFGGVDPQNNWLLGYRRGDFSFSMTNDVKVGGDKFRTAAAEIGIGNFSYGMNIYTTAPPPSEYDGIGRGDYASPIWGENKAGSYSSGSRVYAGMYIGMRNGNNVIRAGVDAPWVQDLFQNGVHRHIVTGPYFDTRLGPPAGLFGQGLYYNPYSLY